MRETIMNIDGNDETYYDFMDEVQSPQTKPDMNDGGISKTSNMDTDEKHLDTFAVGNGQTEDDYYSEETVEQDSGKEEVTTFKEAKKDAKEQFKKEYGKKVKVIGKWWNILKSFMAFLGLIFLGLIGLSIYIISHPEIIQGLV